jgi:hypothetical protein
MGDDIWVGGEVVRCIEGTVEFPQDPVPGQSGNFGPAGVY